jgi:pimeloyl-ACP methyl ester carboxylesterase
MSFQEFDIDVPELALEDLRARLNRTRLPPGGGNDWSAGMNPAYLRDLVEYFRTGYDFRKQEAALNRLAHFETKIDGQRLHFIHERGRGDKPMPLLLTHGFPDSFLRFRKLIPRLTDPLAHGADAADAFDIVVPSLPGYGFSERVDKPGAFFQVGERLHELMQELGYRRYAAHGGDWGSTVSDQLARSHPASIIGIHLTDVPFWRALQKPRDPSPEEVVYLASMDSYLENEGAYALLQGLRPHTLAGALDDSPAGLTAWLVDLFYRFSDNDVEGGLERWVSKDDLLTNVTLYWVTQTIGPAFMPYRDMTHAGTARWLAEKAKDWVGAAAVPAGFALFPKDLRTPPRAWAERFYDVRRWSALPRGGHFAALEEPELLAREIRAFFRPLREIEAGHDVLAPVAV